MSGNYLIMFLVFLPMLASVAGYLIGRANKKLRDYFVQCIVLLEAAAFLYILITYVKNPLTTMDFTWQGFCVMGLNFTVDGFRALYAFIASFMWAMTGLFSGEYFAHYRNRNRYYLFFLLTLGATVGVFLSADLFTTFVFFEIMSLTSYVWVAQEESTGALKAAETYLAVAVIGGLVMLMGLFLLYNEIGTLSIAAIKPAIEGLNGQDRNIIYAAGICMLFGFGAKAGMFPLQIWLPKAHPVAPAPASALLSGILTKAGIYGILIICSRMFFDDAVWGSMILALGVITMFAGALLAVFSVNLKRTLACSSVSQIGFILVGIAMSVLLGEENHMAVSGSLLHMVNHSLIKLVLFMAAGVVYMNIHKLDLNDIRGFGRGKWFLHFIFLMGALGIGGIPLWNGYVSKTLIHESIVEYIELIMEGHLSSCWFSPLAMKVIEWIFLISGGMTVAYMTKLYVALCIEKNVDEKLQEKYDGKKKTYINAKSAIALSVSAILLPIMGFMPNLVMDKAAALGSSIMLVSEEGEAVKYFSLENLKGALISILIGAFLYLVVIRLLLMTKNEDGRRVYVDKWPKWLDMENLIYRPLLTGFLPTFFGIICRILDSLLDWLVVLLRKTIFKDSPLPDELIEGNGLTVFLASVARFFSRFKYKKGQDRPDYEHEFALKYDDMDENVVIVSRSLSFGLFLFCIGLLVTIIYMFIAN